jgi:hypothetical protein
VKNILLRVMALAVLVCLRTERFPLAHPLKFLGHLHLNRSSDQLSPRTLLLSFAPSNVER